MPVEVSPLELIGRGKVLVCQIVKGRDEPQTIALEADRLGDWFWGYNRDSRAG